MSECMEAWKREDEVQARGPSYKADGERIGRKRSCGMGFRQRCAAEAQKARMAERIRTACVAVGINVDLERDVEPVGRGRVVEVEARVSARRQQHPARRAGGRTR
jgi:hypothetical protein